MKTISLKRNHLQIYKRENSKFWQIKIKFPNQKSIRKSSKTEILEEAKNIAIDTYNKNIKFNKINLSFAKNYSFKSYHLIESKELSKREIIMNYYSRIKHKLRKII